MIDQGFYIIKAKGERALERMLSEGPYYIGSVLRFSHQIVETKYWLQRRLKWIYIPLKVRRPFVWCMER